MYVCLCEHTGNPLQSRFKKFQILTLAIPVFVCVCPLLSCCQSTYFMLHHHSQWSHCSVYMLHTGPPLPDLLLAWPQHQGRELCVQHLLNMAWCDGTYFYSSAVGVSHPFLEAPPPTTRPLIGNFFAYLGNPGPLSAAQWLPHHLPPHVLFAISVWCQCI